MCCDCSCTCSSADVDRCRDHEGGTAFFRVEWGDRVSWYQAMGKTTNYKRGQIHIFQFEYGNLKFMLNHINTKYMCGKLGCLVFQLYVSNIYL